MINNRQNGRRRGRGGPRPQNGAGGNGQDRGNRIDNRARGNANQLHEKYKTLARDAQMSGDRVMTEYYLQFADHYFRVLSETRSRFEDQQNQRRDRFDAQDYDDENEGGDEGEDGFDDPRADYAQANGGNGYARGDRQPRDGGQNDGRRNDARQNDGRQNDGRQNEGRNTEGRGFGGDRQQGERNWRDEREGRDGGAREDRPRDAQYREERQDRAAQGEREERAPRADRGPREERAPRDPNAPREALGLRREREQREQREEPAAPVATPEPAQMALPVSDEQAEPAPRRRGRPRRDESRIEVDRLPAAMLPPAIGGEAQNGAAANAPAANGANGDGAHDAANGADVEPVAEAKPRRRTRRPRVEGEAAAEA